MRGFNAGRLAARAGITSLAKFKSRGDDESEGFRMGVMAARRMGEFRKGAPFAGYDDFDACVAANSDKGDPEAYCGSIKHKVEDKQSKLAAAADDFYLCRNNEGQTGNYTIVSGPHTYDEAKAKMKESDEPLSLIQGTHPWIADKVSKTAGQKSARDLAVGDVILQVPGKSVSTLPGAPGGPVVGKVDTTTTPGSVAVWFKGNDGAKADLILNHGDPVNVEGTTASRKTAGAFIIVEEDVAPPAGGTYNLPAIVERGKQTDLILSPSYVESFSSVQSAVDTLRDRVKANGDGSSVTVHVYRAGIASSGSKTAGTSINIDLDTVVPAERVMSPDDIQVGDYWVGSSGVGHKVLNVQHITGGGAIVDVEGVGNASVFADNMRGYWRVTGSKIAAEEKGEPARTTCENCGSSQKYVSSGYCPQCGETSKTTGSRRPFAERTAGLPPYPSGVFNEWMHVPDGSYGGPNRRRDLWVYRDGELIYSVYPFEVKPDEIIGYQWNAVVDDDGLSGTSKIVHSGYGRTVEEAKANALAGRSEFNPQWLQDAIAEATQPRTAGQKTASAQVHTFSSTGEAYNRSQTDDSIRDGDILYIPDEGVVGFLMAAWPVAVTANTGELHALTNPSQPPQGEPDRVCQSCGGTGKDTNPDANAPYRAPGDDRCWSCSGQGVFKGDPPERVALWRNSWTQARGMAQELGLRTAGSKTAADGSYYIEQRFLDAARSAMDSGSFGDAWEALGDVVGWSMSQAEAGPGAVPIDAKKVDDAVKFLNSSRTSEEDVRSALRSILGSKTAKQKCVWEGQSACSDDIFEVYHGSTTPTYICGKHEQQYGVPGSSKNPKTAGKVTCNSCGATSNRQEQLDRCPKCKSSDLRRDVGYPRVAENLRGYPDDITTSTGNYCLKCGAAMSVPGHGIVHREGCPFYTQEDARLQGLASRRQANAFTDDNPFGASNPFGQGGGNQTAAPQPFAPGSDRAPEPRSQDGAQPMDPPSGNEQKDRAVAKLVAGIRETNPGISVAAARVLAEQTIQRFPAMVKGAERKTAQFWVLDNDALVIGGPGGPLVVDEAEAQRLIDSLEARDKIPVGTGTVSYGPWQGGEGRWQWRPSA